MTKQEHIEEIAKIVDEMYNVYTTTADDIAEGLYNAGYRKLDDHAIMVLRKAKGIENRIRKETAEKIFKMLISKLDSNQFLSGKRIIMEVDVENLAKQFDVEIE